MEWLGENAVALLALGLSALALWLQFREGQKSNQPVVHVRAERFPRGTEGFGLFTFSITVAPRSAAQIVEIISVRSLDPIVEVVSPHIRSSKGARPRRVIDVGGPKKAQELVRREHLAPLLVEFAGGGAGTMDDPHVVRGKLVTSSNDAKTAKLEIEITSPTVGGFRGKITAEVKLREFDMIG